MVPALLGFCKPLGNIFFPFLQQVKNIFFKILFVLLAIFLFRHALAGIFFSKKNQTTDTPNNINDYILTKRKINSTQFFERFLGDRYKTVF